MWSGSHFSSAFGWRLACDKPVPRQGVYLNNDSIRLLAAYIKTRSKYLFRQIFNLNLGLLLMALFILLKKNACQT